MSNKGVSGIIATILLVMITIGLVGTAYVYFSGMVGGKTGKTISIETSCNGTAITLVVTNDGTVNVQDDDLSILVDNADRKSSFLEPGGDADYSINPHESIVLVDGTADRYSSGNSYTVLVTSVNSARQVVTC